MVERSLIFANKSMIPFAIALAVVLGPLLVYLYRTERRMIDRRIGLIVTALRVVLLLTLLFMLTEPIVSVTVTEPRQGTLIVMVDNSRSMQVTDRDRPAWEKLRLADALGILPKGAHRSSLASAQDELTSLIADTEAASKRWGDFAEVMALGVIEQKERTERVNETLAAAQGLRKSLAKLVADLAASKSSATPPPPEIASAVESLRSRLADVNSGVLDEMVRELGSADFQARLTVGRLRDINQYFVRAMTQFSQVAAALADTVVRHDTLIAKSALASVPDIMMTLDSATRLELAGRMLADPHVDFLARAMKSYHVRTFLFSRTAGEMPVAVGDNGISVRAVPPASAAEALYTNFSDSVQKTLGSGEPEEISGIVVLSDGRFNNGDDPLKVARQLGSRGVPVYAVTVGSEVPPRDIAVVKVAAPDFVHDKDAVDMDVLVKTEGYEGQTLKLSVLEKGQTVAEKTFVAPAAGRTTVRLNFVPQGKGTHNYVVSIPLQPRETITTNNERPFAISVVDKKLSVLLVDGGPRWEYRFLKNALLRDKRLDLKYLLFDPLTTSREEAQRAVDAFPHKRDELFACDAVILGDVDPAKFTAEDFANLEAFVNDRGGTLIIIAGRNHMPAGYAKTPLASLLPVTPAAEGAPAEVPLDGFSLKLTSEAKQSPIFRLVPDEKENIGVWDALPKMLWYAPAGGVKPGAVVWTYASIDGKESVEESFKRPVTVSHAYGLGRVFYMGADETWRWRYKVADKNFFQFWGQVILWATSGKLPVGTERVKIGTDKFEYYDGEDIVVRARVLNEKKIPVADAMVSARLVKKTDDSEVATTRLDYLPESGGHYEGRFPAVGTGSYVVKLSIPGMESELAGVATDVEVKEAPTRELVELSADAPLMSELAARSGGRSFALADLGKIPDVVKPVQWKHVQTSETPLWSHWMLLIVFCLIVTVEWVLRKLQGLL